MNHKKIAKKDIGNLLNQWSKDYTILVPSKEGDTAEFRVLSSEFRGGREASILKTPNSVLNLDWYRNTVKPPKAGFLPPVEEMFRFQKDKEGYHLDLPPKEGQHLIFGVRPCDARSLAILDNIFTDTYQDPYYLPRRERTVLVGLGCRNPYDSCFCTSLGISPGESEDVDLMLTEIRGFQGDSPPDALIGDEFLIEEISDKGKRLMEQTSGLADATEDDIARAREAQEKAHGKITRKVDTQHLEHKLLSSFEDEDYWENVAAKCIGCGICTFLCPTCYCFDITDEMIKKQGTRFRCWDSCAFRIYTKMPMENPREEKWQRVRQKVCHKFEFHPMSFDVMACTGCGRCIRLCPVNWDICQTLAQLSG